MQYGVILAYANNAVVVNFKKSTRTLEQQYNNLLLPLSLWFLIAQFFNVVSYIIGGRVYTLNDIESGVLRANRKPVGAFKRPFSNDDPRYPIYYTQ